MPYAAINGAKIYYEEFGSGEKIVLTASGGDFKNPDMNRWPWYLAEEGYHLYTITNRGHWKSSKEDVDLGVQWYDTWANDVYVFATEFLGVDRFIYTGLSHGSGIGWHLADAHPECMKAFVAIVCGPHSRLGPETSPARQRTIDMGDLLFEHPEKREEIIAGMAPKLDGLSEAEQTEALRRYEFQKRNFMEMSAQEMRINPRKPFPFIKTEEELIEKLKTIRVPTLMIGGVQDDIIGPADMFRSAVAVPNVKLIMYQDGSHMVANEHLEEVREDITTWLRRTVKD